MDSGGEKIWGAVTTFRAPSKPVVGNHLLSASEAKRYSAEVWTLRRICIDTQSNSLLHHILPVSI